MADLVEEGGNFGVFFRFSVGIVPYNDAFLGDLGDDGFDGGIDGDFFDFGSLFVRD